MQEIPRFRIEEDWGANGDVTIWFEDSLPYELQENIARGLQNAVRVMEKEKRCTHNLKLAVEGYFQKLVDDRKLRWSPVVKHWVWER